MNINALKKKLTIVMILLFIGSTIVPAINTESIKIKEQKDTYEDINNLLYNNFYQDEFVPGELIVKFKEETKITPKVIDNHVRIGLESTDVLNEKHGVKSVERLSKETSSFLSDVYTLTVPTDSDIPSIVEDYNKDPNVEYAEPNYVVRLFNTPNDPYYSEQWGLNQVNDIDIDAPEAWDIETGDENVVIAVIDTGVDYNHPDLKDNIWVNDGEIPDNYIDDDGNGFIDDHIGWDFVSNVEDPIDAFGHGTHCAGIVGAVGNNSIGITGVTWNCKIMPLKVFTDLGSSYSGILSISIHYAANNGADVISMSWGSYGVSQLIKDSLEYAYSKGVVLVGAAGNSNTITKHYPAGFDNVISVGAIDKNNVKAEFSNYGSGVDVAAPGVDVYSTMPTYPVFLNGYGYTMDYSNMSGTSMACPFVAGVIGLILSKNPGLKQREIMTLVHSAVSEIISANFIGKGNINAYECVQNDTVPIGILDSSLDDKEIEGDVEVMGTATGDTFQEYKIFLGFGIYPTSWALVDTSTNSVENGVLTLFNTSLHTDGRYTLKLQVEDLQGYKFEDRTIVLINNDKTMVYVDDDGGADYTTISDAVNNSGSGDTIYVYSGTYHEYYVRIDKSISLIGEDKNTTTIIGTIIYIGTYNVEVSGFNFKIYDSDNQYINSNNYNREYFVTEYKPNAMALLMSDISLGMGGCGNFTIKNNIFSNYTTPPLPPDFIAEGFVAVMVQGIGLYLAGCSACFIKDNTFIGHIYDPSNQGERNSATVGIMARGDSIYIENNQIINNNVAQASKNKGVVETSSDSFLNFENESLPCGIYLTGSGHIVKNNEFENNLKGMQFVAAQFCTINDNQFFNNKHGMYLDMAAAFYCNIHHNIIKNNQNAISLGRGTGNNNIYNNIIENNTIGIKGLDCPIKMFEGLMSDSQFYNINNNSIRNNDIGIYGKNWVNNTIYDNNIENNTKYGLQLVKSKQNNIYRNNFINNGKFLSRKPNARSSIGNKWDNGVEGNYWDDYRGAWFKRIVDHDGDGFGNFPYYIPRLQLDKHPKLEPYNISI